VTWDNWATVADLATALGTLILAVATFSAAKSANLTAKVAQRSLLAGLRPVLMASRRDDPMQKVNFGDKWGRIPGGGAPQRRQRHRRATRLAFLPPLAPLDRARAA
jgi:hypothetical protein